MSASLARDARRLPLSGSTFIRTLAALDDVPADVAAGAFAPRLARWFDWTHAFSLSAALSDVAVRAPAFGGPGASSADEREVARVRAALARTIADAPAGGAEPRRVGRPLAAATTAAAPAPPVDFATCRQRYAACQLAMETQIAPLRRRLRASLAERSPALARLAELDAVMEQVVGARERALLSTVASRLEPRFEHWLGRREPTAPAAPALERFRQEMRGLLLAELDLRLQPVEGLLEARRKSVPTP